MAKTDNLIHYLSDVANAIREKEGSTDPINAQDFSERIRSISVGSDPGFADYYYFNNAYIPIQNGGQVEASPLFFNFFENIFTNTPDIAPLCPLFKFQFDDSAIITQHKMLGSGANGCAQFAIPKYLYTNEIICGSGIGGYSSFPEYTDTIQLFRNIEDEETSTMMNSIMDQLMEHQITSEQFWNE